MRKRIRTCVPRPHRVMTVRVRPHIRITRTGIRTVRTHFRSRPR